MLQLVILCAVGVLVGIDQLTKWWAVSSLKGNDPVMVIDNIFSFTYTQNEGAAWSILEGQRLLLIVLTSVMLLAMAIVLLCGRFRKYKMATVGGVLVLSGGIGNLIDRIIRGYVVDFLKTEFMDFPIFNVADCFVVIGALLLFVYFVFIYTDSSDEKNSPVEAEKKGAEFSGDIDD